MKIYDTIIAAVCGESVALLFADFLKEGKAKIIVGQEIILLVSFPLLSILCLWIAYLIGRKFLFVFQAAKHLLVGAFVTVVDLKVFEFLFEAIFYGTGIMSAKIASFIVATFIKYFGNKHWAFQNPPSFADWRTTEGQETKSIGREAAGFFAVSLAGLALDAGIFYYLVKIVGPQFAIPSSLWIKLSVIFAALAAAAWNFWGCKFLVFKK